MLLIFKAVFMSVSISGSAIIIYLKQGICLLVNVTNVHRQLMHFLEVKWRKLFNFGYILNDIGG